MARLEHLLKSRDPEPAPISESADIAAVAALDEELETPAGEAARADLPRTGSDEVVLGEDAPPDGDLRWADPVDPAADSDDDWPVPTPVLLAPVLLASGGGTEPDGDHIPDGEQGWDVEPGLAPGAPVGADTGGVTPAVRRRRRAPSRQTAGATSAPDIAPAAVRPGLPETPVDPAPAAAVARAPRRTTPAAGKATIPARNRPRPAARRPRTPPVLAACPSCALLLDPPPAASRRCARCRARIVVKRVTTGVLFLTEAAAAAFEEARLQAAESGRHARVRDRWLALAMGVAASPGPVARLASAPASAASAAAARGLYASAANRAYAAARRERRWSDAAAVRRTQATALHRADGASDSPGPDVLAAYRDAVAADLRAIAETVRDAAMVGADCCDACRADAGLVARATVELRATRLPHAGCPSGLCRCRWTAVRPARRPGR